MEEKEKIYCFDFDGTLTTRDTLLEIIRYDAGTWPMLLGFLLYSPLLVLMKLHLFPNWKAKQLIFSYFFKHRSLESFDDMCCRFAQTHQDLLRPHIIDLVRKAIEAHHRVFIVSASIENWVRPFLKLQGIEGVEVLGTQIAHKDNLLTGRFCSANCYGEEKVHRICQALTRTLDNGKGVTSFSFDRTHYYIYAYGDSRGDREMLAFADKGYYIRDGKPTATKQ